MTSRACFQSHLVRGTIPTESQSGSACSIRSISSAAESQSSVARRDGRFREILTNVIGSVLSLATETLNLSRVVTSSLLQLPVTRRIILKKSEESFELWRDQLGEEWTAPPRFAQPSFGPRAVFTRQDKHRVPCLCADAQRSAEPLSWM